MLPSGSDRHDHSDHGDHGPVELVRSARLAAVPYAYAATPARGGRYLFTAGACPLGLDGRVVAPGDLVAQTEQVVANLRTALEEAGADLDCVVKTTVYVASEHRDDLHTAWRVVAGAFAEHDAPSTLLGVTVLGHPDQLVELDAVAVLP